MPATAIALLLLSAALHTAWNVMLKRVLDKYIATWWVVITGGLLSLAGLAFTGPPPRAMWLFVVFSVLAEVLYFLLLSWSYGVHEFSLVYPLARGAAPAMLVLWSYVFLHEGLTGGGMAGLGLIMGGLLIIGSSAFRGAPRVGIPWNGIATSLAIAVLISIYTFIDGAAVKRTAALPYALSVFALIPLPVTPIVLRHYGWTRLVRTWREQGINLVLISVLGIAAYLLALRAYRIAPLSYAGAIREVSVVMGALAGWQVLREKQGRARLIGALAVFAGILLIALVG
jgi:drug/metabolite transporter (DMT)-like permease